MPGTVVAEAGYLLSREGGAVVEGQFLTSLADGTLRPVELTREDYVRAGELVLADQSLLLGTTDAVSSQSACGSDWSRSPASTADNFTVVRPRHAKALTLLPE